MTSLRGFFFREVTSRVPKQRHEEPLISEFGTITSLEQWHLMSAHPGLPT
jgi:hypothetical protein